ncbi:hypothetical protein [Frigoribacterium sp. CG_9.8]|uniref:hypothetical protein n=1 Tax=Frigoribacterium sp. CG_9.8 TaxID=2787733 RepID=UPI0018CA75D0|nr:hypothetical protein [Frigoribacterium sp. CG_9.8]MBG6106588.1 hypothetical protein [Frigoribacterium sp. CG_9.8]
MTIVTISAEPNRDTFQAPWPVTFDGTTGEVIHGRPDAIRLIGFVHPSDSFKMIVFGNEVTPNKLSAIIGLVPVYSDPDGHFFGTEAPVRAASVFTGERAPLDAANDLLVAALDRIKA